MPRPAAAEARLLGAARGLALRALALLALLGALAAAPGASRALADTGNAAARAVTSYEAMQRNYYLPAQHLYRGAPGRFSYLWPFSQALSATVGVAVLAPAYRAAIRDRLTGLADYWTSSESPPSYSSYLGGSGASYYDDNEWVGLQLVRIYRLTGNRRALARAQDILRLAIYGWDLDTSHACPGGVWWTQDPNFDTRNTVSNAPAAELGLELFELTGRRSFLGWGERFYTWVRGCLLQQAGLFSDNVGLEGAIDPTVWIYNQGTMLGAATLLYRITRDPTYLVQAQAGAAATLAYFEPQRLQSQPSFFISIFLENLRMFEATDSAISFRPALEQYAQWAWQSARDPSSGLFDFHRGEPLLDQASMTQIYATLAAGEGLFLPPRHAHQARQAAHVG